MAGILLTGGAARGANGSPTTQQQKVAASPSTATHTATPVAATGAPPDAISRAGLRAAVARLLEDSLPYRTGVDDRAPRLLDTKFLGPVRRRLDLFAAPEAIYCASAKIDVWPLPYERVTRLKVLADKDGKSRIIAATGMVRPPSGCELGTNEKAYGPFPELAALRQKRRFALGKKD